MMEDLHLTYGEAAATIDGKDETDKSDEKYVVRVKTFLTESSLATGRSQPSNNMPICAHYSNEKKKSSKKRKAEAAPTVLEYNLHYMPRILKNDLRRQYPVMFTNVFNSCDFNFVQMFLETFCRPDLVNVLDSLEPHVHMRKEAHGFDDCRKEIIERMTDSADTVFALKEVQMRVKSDGSCAIHSKFELSGTKIIYIDPRRMMNIIMKLMSRGRVAGAKAAAAQSEQQHNNNPQVLDLPFTPKPPAHLIEASSPSSARTVAPPSATELSKNPLIIAVPLRDEIEQGENEEDRSRHSSIDSDESSLLSEFDEVQQDHQTLPSSQPQAGESDSAYLYRKFNDAMNVHRNFNEVRKLEETLPIAVPYRYCGEFVLLTDLESKISNINFVSRLRRQ